MDNGRLIEELRSAGISFEPGMSEAELDRAERAFQFRFPKEIREFLSLGVPVDPSFFHYRDVSEINIKGFEDFQAFIENHFRFDLENNREDMFEMLGKKLGFDRDSEDFHGAVMDYLHRSVRLIPFYAHRCFFDGMDGMPIVSFWQPTDTIFYGGTFENYLEHEFLRREQILVGVRERMKDTGIWADLIW